MKRYAIYLVLAAIMVFAFTACGGDTEAETDATQDANTVNNAQDDEPIEIAHDDIAFFYEFNELGFSLEFPGSIDGIYEFHETRGFGSPFYFNNVEPGPYHRLEIIHAEWGVLASITSYPNIGYTYEALDAAREWFGPDIRITVLAETAFHVYYLIVYELEGDVAVEKHIELEYLWEVITSSFRLIVLDQNEGILYQFPDYGFYFTLPTFWEGKYGMDIREGEGDFEGWVTVELYHPATVEEFEELGFGGYTFFEGEYHRAVGTLFRFGRAPGEHFTDNEPPIMAGGSRILAQTGGYTYFMNFPSDVQHNDSLYSEVGNEYLEMVGYWREIYWEFFINGFGLIDAVEN